MTTQSFDEWAEANYHDAVQRGDFAIEVARLAWNAALASRSVEIPKCGCECDMCAAGVCRHEHPAADPVPSECRACAAERDGETVDLRHHTCADPVVPPITTDAVDWMKCDAQTILDVMNQGGGWIKADWPHEEKALEKLRRILKSLAAQQSLPFRTTTETEETSTIESLLQVQEILRAQLKSLRSTIQKIRNLTEGQVFDTVPIPKSS